VSDTRGAPLPTVYDQRPDIEHAHILSRITPRIPSPSDRSIEAPKGL
jgi:hypothetical protein